MDTLRVVRVFSIDELRAISREKARDTEAVLWPSKKRYLYDPGSSAADDGDTVITPSEPSPNCGDCCNAVGRWLLENKPPTVSLPPAVFFVNKTDGDVGLGGMSAIPGMLISLTLAQDSDVTINWSAAFSITAFSAITARLTVDGVDYDWTVWSQINGAGGDTSHNCHASHTITLPLSAGSRSIELKLAATNAGLYADTSTPASLTAIVWTP